MNQNYWKSPEKDKLFYCNASCTLADISKLERSGFQRYEARIKLDTGVICKYWDDDLERLRKKVVIHFCTTCGKLKVDNMKAQLCKECEKEAVENFKALKEQRLRDDVLDRVEALEEQVKLILAELTKISSKSKKRKTST
jgi:MFS superfamily sulfate permease-like transporter